MRDVEDESQFPTITARRAMFRTAAIFGIGLRVGWATEIVFHLYSITASCGQTQKLQGGSAIMAF
jgi:hypothetical protein